MRAVFWIAWRYLWGRKSERFVSLISIISILGVAIGVAALIVVLAVMSGFDKDLKEKIIGNYSHIVIEKDSPIEDWPKLKAQVDKIKHISASAPFIQGQAFLQSGNHNRGVVVRGVDLDMEAKVTKIDQYLLSGKKDLGDGIYIGRELSYLLGLKIGDEVELVNSFGMNFSFPLQGLFNSGMYDYDTSVAFISLDKAQEFFGLDEAVNGVSVQVDKLFLADKVKKEIEAKIGPGYYARTWMERNRNFFAALKLEKITMFIILTLIVLVAAFNIISALVVMVTEKTQDIGILKAIGMNSSRIRAIFTLEGLFIGSLGILAGSFLGITICALLKKYQFIKLPADIYYLDRLPVSLELWPDVSTVIISAFCISLLSTVYPAKKASRLNPVQALRYE